MLNKINNEKFKLYMERKLKAWYYKFPPAARRSCRGRGGDGEEEEGRQAGDGDGDSAGDGPMAMLGPCLVVNRSC